MDGWICLHRRLLEWEWYTETNTLCLFLHLLLSANHKEKKWRGVTVKKGQLITGRKTLSIETGLSERNIRTALKNLQKTNEVTIKTTKHYSIISITNWDKYQSSDQQNDQQNDQKATKDRPTPDQRPTTNNNDNKNPVGTEPPSLDKLLFDLGRKTLGEKSGGIVAKLKKEKGIAEAYNIIELASTKSDPTQYVMACLKPKKIGITPLGVGG